MSRERQSHILNFVRENGDTKKSELVSKFDHWYYMNSAKHIGDILFRMVQNGKLERFKKGWYRIGAGVKSRSEILDPNQVEIKFN